MDETNNQRLSGLNETNDTATISRGYSRFVRFMRLALPLFALVLMVVVITWPELDQQIEAIPQEDILGTDNMTIGSNELLNPEYQTTDSQNNPVNIKASKATQSQNNKDLIRLDIPEAKFQTQQGDHVSVMANQGTYDQAGEKLFLQDSVKITHEKNYTLDAQELRLNMKTQQAFSDKDVTITGDNAVLEATGIDGNMQEGTLNFKGPATVTFNPKKQNPLMPNTAHKNSQENIND